MEVMEDVIERNELSEGSHWHGEESCGCERERERMRMCGGYECRYVCRYTGVYVHTSKLHVDTGKW